MTAPEGRGEGTDQASIQAVVDAFFAAFVTGPDLADRMATLRGLFAPRAVITRTCGLEPAVTDVDAFIEPRQALLADGTLSQFRESPTRGRIEAFGDIAHWFAAMPRRGGAGRALWLRDEG